MGQKQNIRQLRSIRILVQGHWKNRRHNTNRLNYNVGAR